MGYKLVNINNRSALLKDNNYYDLETISNGDISSNSIKSISSIEKLSSLYQKLDTFIPTGSINDISLDALLKDQKIVLQLD